MEVYVAYHKDFRDLRKVRFRLMDRRQKIVIKDYEETAKTIDTRLSHILQTNDNSFVKADYKWGEKRKNKNKKREATKKEANLLTEKVLANK